MIDAIKKGSTAAFEQAFLMYREKVFAYFFKKTSSLEDAEDLVQITFIKLWQYRNSLSENFLLEQHLFHIARTAFIDFLRTQSKFRKTKVSLKEIGNLTVENQQEFDLKSQLYKSLSEMPEIRKRVFELHRLEGYSYKEIAEILSIPVKSVDNNLAKALKYLRNTELFLIIFITTLFL